MVYLSFTLMFLSNVLWAFHDLYFWDKKIKEFVLKIGWHIIKAFMILFFGISLIMAGWLMHEMRLPQIAIFIFALMLARWGGFEGTYNVFYKDAKLFDWFKHIKICITKKRGFEYLLHNVFRLHWIEAGIVLVVGLLIIGRL